MNLTSIESLLNSVDDFFYTYLLAALLILVGLYLTARTHLVQLRHFGTMVNSLSGSRSVRRRYLLLPGLHNLLGRPRGHR